MKTWIRRAYICLFLTVGTWALIRAGMEISSMRSRNAYSFMALALTLAIIYKLTKEDFK